ncbi:MAG: FliH/SctL family protein [Roseburia sp.]|nr:FliH/SctL family protein [Roseburia sp.]
MSKGSVLKSGWVTVNPADTRVIDSNALAELKLKELAEKLAEQYGEEPEFAEGFSQGIDATQVSELMGSDINIIGGEDGFPEVEGADIQPGLAQQSGMAPHEELILEAQAQIEQMKQEAIAEIERAREKALEEGREAGYQEGLELGRNEGFEQGHKDGLDSVAGEREQALAEVEQSHAAIEQEYERKLKEMEPVFIDTLTKIYEHIFHVRLQNSRDIIVYLIQNTMKSIEGNNSYLIHVSKEDYPFASMQKKELVQNTSISPDVVEIVEDATLSRNECMIETGNGVFDCSLGTQLEALNEELRLLSYEPD